MGKTFNTGYLQNIIQYDGSNNIILPSLIGTGTRIVVAAANGTLSSQTASTTNIAEGTNLYYTDTRVGTYLSANTYATQSYVTTAIANLVDASPATLDTLNELAAALGDDPNFATTVATSIGTKQAQLNGTGFVKVSGTTVSYDNSTYLTTSSASSTYVPYTGASADLVLGANNFSSKRVSVLKSSDGYGGFTSNYLFLQTGSSTTNVGTDGISLFSKPNQRALSINYDIAGVNYSATLDANLLNASRTFEFPNASGILALTSNIPTLSSLGGQTALSGTGFVKISGTTISYDNSTYLTTASATSTYLPLAGGSLTGNLSIGGFTITELATGYKGIQLQDSTGGLLSGSSYAVYLTSNAIIGTTGWVRGGAAYATARYSQFDGQHIFYAAAASSAGSAITWNTLFTIASTGLSTFSNNIVAEGGLIKSYSSNNNAFVDIDGSTSGVLGGIRLYSSGSTKWIISHSLPSTYRFSIGTATGLTTFTERFGIDHSSGVTTITAKAADADRTIPLNVLTITAEQGNAPYGFFGGAILFKNRSYTSGLVDSARIRSVIYDDGAPNNFGGGLWFETTPTPGGTLTPSLKISYTGAATFSNNVTAATYNLNSGGVININSQNGFQIGADSYSGGFYIYDNTAGVYRFKIANGGAATFSQALTISGVSTLQSAVRINNGTDGTSPKLVFGNENESTLGFKGIYLESYWMYMQVHYNEGLRIRATNGVGATQTIATFAGSAGTLTTLGSITSGGNLTAAGDITANAGASTAITVYNASSIRAKLSMTGNEGDLSLYGSSANRLVYLSAYYDSYINAGKVGIGTSGPYTKLDVRGSIGMGNADTYPKNAKLVKQGSTSITFTASLGTIGAWRPGHVMIKVSGGQNGLQEYWAAWFFVRIIAYVASSVICTVVDSGGETGAVSFSSTSDTNSPQTVYFTLTDGGGTTNTMIADIDLTYNEGIVSLS